MDKLFNLEPKKKRKGKLSTLQVAQLQDCAAAGSTVKVMQAARSTNKGYKDTPLFQVSPEANPTLF